MKRGHDAGSPGRAVRGRGKAANTSSKTVFPASVISPQARYRSRRINPDIHIPFGRIPLAIGAAGLQPAEIVDSHEAVRALTSNY
jgi:hypothetical protein